MNKFIIVVLSSIFFVTSCAENNGKLVKAPINPNGDSELALIMRNMHLEAFEQKKKILNGEDISIKSNYENMLSAEATEKGQNRSSKFLHFAKQFNLSTEALLAGNKEEKVGLFNAFVNNCMSCHQSMCPGPMVKIKKLYIDPVEVLEKN